MPNLNALVASPWFQLSSFLFGFVGLAITVVAIFASRKNKRLNFSRRSFTLVQKNKSTVTSLEVKVSGRVVSALTITKIMLWNSGKEAIRASDFPNKQRLRIVSSRGVEILESEIIQTSSESCNCAIEAVSPDELLILFEFLDPNDGLVLQIAHTGISGRALDVEGQIVGKGRISEKTFTRIFPFDLRGPNRRVYRRSSPFRRWLLGCGSVAIGLMMIITTFFGLFDQGAALEISKKALTIITWIGGITYLAFGVNLLRSRLPKGLESFEDSFARNEEKKG